MHLPFPVLKVWPISLGLLIERQSDSEQGPMSTDRAFANEEPLPRLFTLSSPLEDFGMVACNGPSLASDEEILFISSQSDSLCLTRNTEQDRITLWCATPDQQARRKVGSLLAFANEVSTILPTALINWAEYVQLSARF